MTIEAYSRTPSIFGTTTFEQKNEPCNSSSQSLKMTYDKALEDMRKGRKAAKTTLTSKRIKKENKASGHTKQKIPPPSIPSTSHEKKTSLYQTIKADKNISDGDTTLKQICKLIRHRKVEKKFITHLQTICAINNEEERLEMLGLLLYFLDTHLKIICGKVARLKSVDFIEWLRKEFQQKLSNITMRIDQTSDSHHKVRLQHRCLTHQTLLSIEVAKILITRRRYLNYPLADLLINYFIKNKEYPLNHEYSLLNGLLTLRNSPSFRAKFSNIKKPHYKHKFAQDLIRVQLGLPPSTLVNTRHTMITILTACLSRPRQGSVGSCFATHLAIILHSSHLELCLNDFIQLIDQGELRKTVNQTVKKFPFLLRIRDQNLNELTLRLSPEGKVFNKEHEEVYLWESPGIMAACNAIGVANPISTILNSLQTFPISDKHDGYPIEIALQPLLKAVCVEYIRESNLPHSLLPNIISLASFAFQSQARNGLLSIWGNCLAGMAEGKNGSMIKPSVLNAICKPLARAIHHLLGRTESSKETAKMFIETIKMQLWNSLHLNYDPHIYNTSLDAENDVPEGGFVIYDIQNTTFPSKWLRIDTPALYQQFVEKIVQLVKPKIISLLETEHPKINAAHTIEKLLNYINSPEFITKSMLTYYPKYSVLPNLLEVWEECPYTPWRTISGNVAQSVHEVYFELQSPFSTQIFTPSNPREILICLIENIRYRSQNPQTDNLINPHLRLPLLTTTHAFSLLPNHPSLIQAALSSLDPSQWIDEQIVEPGMEVANSKVSKETIRHTFEWITQHLKQHKEHQHFHKIIDFLPSELSVLEFRQWIGRQLNAINTEILSDPETINQLETEICLSLTDDQKKKWQSSAVHFADTNWNEGYNDINFCIAIHPCSGLLSILEIQDDGRSIRPIKDHTLLKSAWNYCYGAIEVINKQLSKINDVRISDNLLG